MRCGFVGRPIWNALRPIVPNGTRLLAGTERSLANQARRARLASVTTGIPTAKSGPQMGEVITAEALRSAIAPLHRQGLSLQQIADNLNRTGVPTASGGGRWHKQTVTRMLERLSPR